jgi:hypothetical protein
VKLLTHVRDGVERAGVLVDGRVFDLPKAARLIELIAEPTQLDQVVKSSVVGSGTALEELFVTAPLGPVAIRMFDAFEPAGEEPTLAFGNPWAICGPNDDAAVPPGCNAFDFGVQLGVVIGQPGRNIAEEDAHQHIAGYVLVNVWQARDLGRDDSAIAVGPMLVTPDELTADVTVRATVNGHTRAEGSLHDMAWPFASLIAYASRGTSLGTGDLLTSGPLARDEVRPSLSVDDVLAVTADVLGEQAYYVVAGEPLHAISPRRVEAIAESA